MIDGTLRDQEDAAAADAAEIRQVFVIRVHQVLQEGYARIDAAKHQATPEPALTGELVRSMKSFLGEMSAPEWADHFSVHDDPPVNDPTRFGKDRRRVDVRVDSATPRPGAGFSFEAKRLARGYAVAKYLGDEGLSRFLCGDYAREDNDAGMIGYVQDDDAGYWAAEIEGALGADPGKHGVAGTDWWRAHVFPHGPQHVFASTHTRSAVGRPIIVYHTLLLFNPQSSL